MEDIEKKLPEHISRSIDRNESAATKMDEKSGAMLGSKDDPIKVAKIRNVLAEKKFAHQRTVEHIRSEFGLQPKHRVARRQIEERKAGV